MTRPYASLLLTVLITVVLSPGTALGRSDSGLPAQIAVGDVNLSLIKQQTVRYAGLIRIYSLAFYTRAEQQPKGMSGPTHCLIAVYHRALTRELLAEAANRILQRQHPPEVIQRHRESLEQLHEAYVDIHPGDRYRLCHIAGTGLSLSHNQGTPLILGNEDFARLYLGIWLGPDGILDDS